MTSPHPWTASERTFLVDTHATLTAVEQARQLGLEYDCVCFQRQRLIRAGLIAPAARKYGRLYTAAEDDQIRTLVQEGRSVAFIAKRLGRSWRAIYSHIVDDLGGVRRLRTNTYAMVRTPAEVGVLFGCVKGTVTKWIRRGWLKATPNRVTGRQRAGRLITDAALEAFLAEPHSWPAWHPSDITDRDWQQHARAIRQAAGGDWVSVRVVVARGNFRPGQVYAWFRRGDLAQIRQLRYGAELLVWSADVDLAVTTIRAGGERDGRYRQRRKEATNV